jgi:acetyl-CoA carboxylase carboxyltransferase component
MGSPGVEFVYKDELRGLRGSVNGKVKELSQQLVSEGAEETAALEQAKKEVTQWLTGEEAVLVKRYEKELMNPKEALSLGSISQITMPSDLRQVLSEHMKFHLENYTPEPFNGVQREFH